MEKSLDGIKKLDPADIKKYRKIILNYIGEKDSTGAEEQKDSSQKISSKPPLSRKVDGINLNEINRFAPKKKIESKKFSARDGSLSALPERKRGEQAEILDGKKEEAEKARALEDRRLKEAIKRQEEERKRIKEEEKQYQLNKEQAERDRRNREEKQKQEKIKQEKIRQIEIEKEKQKLAEKELRERQESIKQEELKKRETIEQVKREAKEIKRVEEIRRSEEKRKIEESLRLENIKRREEAARMKLEKNKVNLAAQEKKRIKRQKAWRKTKRNFNLKLSQVFSKIKKNIIYIISFPLLFLAIIYVVFCLTVLRFKIDNKTIDWLAGYLPVPAVITSQGIINYNDFRKIEDKDYLAEFIVLRDLRKKYGYPGRTADNNLAILYVNDKDFNQVGLSRINKINELLKGRSEVEQLGKYADEYNDGAYYDVKSAVEKFGPVVSGLIVGQISNIIFRADGYYIIEKIDDKNGRIGLKYIFVKARTLDQYINNRIKKIKVFILAD